MQAEVPGFLYLIVSVLFGLCLGSFATALAWRLPRGQSMVAKTRSACPSCNKDLSALDLVPVFSWLFLRGRCRRCKAPIGWQYPLIELATVFLCVAIYLRFGFSLQTVFLFALAPVMTAMTDIDFRFKIIPDELNIAVFVTGLLVLGASMDPDFIIDHGGQGLLGSLLYGLGALALRAGAQVFLKREAMGLGDVKFFFAAGFWLGPSLETLAWFMILAGGSGVVLALLWRKLAKEAEFPFGPSLIAAFLAILFILPPLFITH